MNELSENEPNPFVPKFGSLDRSRGSSDFLFRLHCDSRELWLSETLAGLERFALGSGLWLKALTKKRMPSN